MRALASPPDRRFRLTYSGNRPTGAQFEVPKLIKKLDRRKKPCFPGWQYLTYSGKYCHTSGPKYDGYVHLIEMDISVEAGPWATGNPDFGRLDIYINCFIFIQAKSQNALVVETRWDKEMLHIICLMLCETRTRVPNLTSITLCR
jgi:hypothetical protein